MGWHVPLPPKLLAYGLAFVFVLWIVRYTYLQGGGSAVACVVSMIGMYVDLSSCSLADYFRWLFWWKVRHGLLRVGGRVVACVVSVAGTLLCSGAVRLQTCFRLSFVDDEALFSGR